MLNHFMTICLGFSMITACATSDPTRQETQSAPTWVVTQNAEDEYSKALERWESHKVSSYEITVNIFSSFLSPPCLAKATLTVRQNKLMEIHETETPIPIQIPDGNILYNPECHDYENYLVTKQFEIIKKLLTGELPYKWGASFDSEYGYIQELTFATDGESMKSVSYFNFSPK